MMLEIIGWEMCRERGAQREASETASADVSGLLRCSASWENHPQLSRTLNVQYRGDVR